jgi:hypothetical protein
VIKIVNLSSVKAELWAPGEQRELPYEPSQQRALGDGTQQECSRF